MDRILLLIDTKQNRDHLLEVFAGIYDVIDSGDKGLEADFDLCICDGPAVARLPYAIRKRKEREAPVFLPVLFITGRLDVTFLTRHLWKEIDDLVLMPTGKLELQARVEVLLRARRLALEVKRKDNEIARLSHMRLQVAIKAANVGLWEWHPRTNAVVFSAEWKRQLGYEDNEVTDDFSEWQRRVHPDDLPLLLDMAQKASADLQSDYVAEFRMRHKDGTWRWFFARGSFVAGSNGGDPVLIGCDIDITTRKQAEEQLRKLTTIIEQSPVAVAMADTSGKIRYINHQFTEMTGYPHEEVEGKDLNFPASGKSNGPDYSLLRQAISSGNTWQGTFASRKKNGGIFWERATFFPLRSDGGEIINFVAIREDITREKILEESLRQAQKMEAVGTLTGGIAHDFNNVLTVLSGTATLLERKIPEDPALKNLVRIILESTNRAAVVTRSLLAFSRKEEGTYLPVRISEVVRALQPMLERVIGRDIDLQFELPEEDPLVPADKVQIEQVLLNLVINARDAMPQGGACRIAVERAEMDSAFIEANGFGREGSYIRLLVADTGTGMDAETMSKIFDPFFTTKEVGKGTGLGLSMAYGIIKNHHGFIVCSSKPGAGTTFYVYLPVDDSVPA